MGSTDYKVRLDNEYSELQIKLSKLVDFMHTDKYTELPPVQQGLLMVQQAAMKLYADTLERRGG